MSAISQLPSKFIRSYSYCPVLIAYGKTDGESLIHCTVDWGIFELKLLHYKIIQHLTVPQCSTYTYFNSLCV